MVMTKAACQQVYGLLSDSELELVKQLCLPHKIVCQNLGINEGALNMRVKRLAQRFGVENKRALIVKIIQLGMVPVNDFDYRVF